MRRKEAARRPGLIKFVKKIVKKDEDRINGWGKKCNGSFGVSRVPLRLAGVSRPTSFE